MTLTIKITKRLIPQISAALAEMGYEDEESFVQMAIEDKLLELRKGKFYQITDKIREGLRIKGISIGDVYKDFKTKDWF